MSDQATHAQVVSATIREKDAEIEYLRQRNLNLSIALETVSGRLAALQAEHGDPEAGGEAGAE